MSQESQAKVSSPFPGKLCQSIRQKGSDGMSVMPGHKCRHRLLLRDQQADEDLRPFGVTASALHS